MPANIIVQGFGQAGHAPNGETPVTMGYGGAEAVAVSTGQLGTYRPPPPPPVLPVELMRLLEKYLSLRVGRHG